MKIKNKKIKGLLVLFMTAVMVMMNILPEMVYADDIEQNQQYLVQDGYSGQYAGRDDDPHITGYYKGKLTLEESQKHIAFYVTKKDGSNLNLGVEYDTKYINWNNDFYWQAVSSEWSSGINSCLMTNQFNGVLKYYIFNTSAEAQAYIKSGDASGALNGSDVVSPQYNGDIPLPDSFEIKYLDRSTVDCFFSYSNDTELSTFGKELHYEIVPDYVYATTSFTKAIVGGTALGATGNAAKMCQYIQSTVQGGVMNLPTTVEAYISDPGSNKNKLYTQSDKTPATGLVASSNSQSMTPTDYSQQFATSSAFSAFWGGATNLNIAYFVGAQLSLRLYYVEDGNTYYSNKIVVRYFSNDIINSLVGKKKTVVGKDDKGEDIVIDEGPTDPTTPVTPGDIKDVDLVSYVKRLFTSITSYTALMQTMLVHVPAEIWYLIAAALAVSLVVIVFKVLRGM